MEVVGDNGKLFRIEPSAASGKTLTDAAAYSKAHPNTSKFELIQDDQWFDAAVVGMGCLGMIYSVVLGVRPAFLLKETRTLTTWSQVKAALQGGAIYRTPDHYELLLNPYVMDGQNRCLITTRVETQTRGDRERSIYIKYRAVLDVSALLVRFLAWFWPSKIKATLNTAIEALRDDDYTECSERTPRHPTGRLQTHFSQLVIAPHSARLQTVSCKGQIDISESTDIFDCRRRLKYGCEAATD
jgi:hypothetical protein